MAIAAVDADDRVHQLILLTERLTDLIAKEAHAFETHRPHEAAQYVEETAKLANVYRHESMRVRANVALVEAARLDRPGAGREPGAAARPPRRSREPDLHPRPRGGDRVPVRASGGLEPHSALPGECRGPDSA